MVDCAVPHTLATVPVVEPPPCRLDVTHAPPARRTRRCDAWRAEVRRPRAPRFNACAPGHQATSLTRRPIWAAREPEAKRSQPYRQGGRGHAVRRSCLGRRRGVPAFPTTRLHHPEGRGIHCSCPPAQTWSVAQSLSRLRATVGRRRYTPAARWGGTPSTSGQGKTGHRRDGEDADQRNAARTSRFRRGPEHGMDLIR